MGRSILKCRRRTLYKQLRPHPGKVFRRRAERRGSRVEEGHWMPDHVPMMISIPPKYAVSRVLGFVQGKGAIHRARVYRERQRSFIGPHFWARATSSPRSAGAKPPCGSTSAIRSTGTSDWAR